MRKIFLCLKAFMSNCVSWSGGRATYDIDFAFSILFYTDHKGCIQVARGILEAQERLVRTFDLFFLFDSEEDLEGIRISKYDRLREKFALREPDPVSI